ncbi:phosphatidylinositol-4-phosphate 5-kinase [Dorcoceras hygrometricum]|uniref:Phosphatidylinositol-4-phosphate 5-kinase n=1 Tax=Dorcoceras hygrometricum TaxID=472368 RepID=A0A2Z7CHP2_9LAMI|nr:phosphatidylinositol-4-phosphate 5-kinase [Dorcoceras hygrometricum]
MGIDQLGFQSVQLGYLKILKMGNADPNNKKQEKEYEKSHSTDFMPQLLACYVQAVNKSSTRTLNSQYATSTDLTRHRNYSLLKIATSMVTSNTSGTSLELKSVKDISYLSSQLNFSSLIPTLKSAEELSGLACEINQATLLLRVPSPTSTQTSQLVSIERATQEELIATGLAPNNGGNRRQFTGEVFE